MERFAGLNICGFNPTEVFVEILSHCLSQKYLLFKERCFYSQKNFHGTLENCGKFEILAQRIFPHLQHMQVTIIWLIFIYEYLIFIVSHHMLLQWYCKLRETIFSEPSESKPKCLHTHGHLVLHWLEQVLLSKHQVYKVL